MAKRLLAERFGLRFHVERQSFKVHAMKLALRDGQLGRGLRPTRCVMPPSAGTQPAPTSNAAQDEQRPCGAFTRNVVDGLTRFRFHGFSLRTLLTVHRVEAVLGTRVIDETGLDGIFDVDLEYVPDPFIWRMPDAPAASGPSLINAFEAQLGLRFERRDQMLDQFVIDAVSALPPE